MTNFEAYQAELQRITDSGDAVAVVKGKPVGCNSLSGCNKCDLYDEISCKIRFSQWLFSEYKEPAPTLTPKERAFCEIINDREGRFIARDKNGELNVYHHKVERSIGFWDGLCGYLRISPSYFPFIKWEDEKLWSIEDLLKLEVHDND